MVGRAVRYRAGMRLGSWGFVVVLVSMMLSLVFIAVVLMGIAMLAGAGLSD